MEMTVSQLPASQLRFVGILEDDTHIADQMKLLFGAFNLVPCHLFSAEDAIKMSRENEATCFILDVQIGNTRQGLDALEEIKKINPHAFVGIYSHYLDAETLRRRAKKLKADLILRKTTREKEDILRIAQSILRYQTQLISLDMSLIERELEHLQKGESGSVNWNNWRIEPPMILTSHDVQSDTLQAGLFPNLDKDPNITEYERLVNDSSWLKCHEGAYVGIVHGKLEEVSQDEATVLKRLRERFPSDARFVKSVEPLDDFILELPSPFAIE